VAFQQGDGFPQRPEEKDQSTEGMREIYQCLSERATFGVFIVGQASRLPSNDLPTQARRLRYIQQSKSKLLLVLLLLLGKVRSQCGDRQGIVHRKEAFDDNQGKNNWQGLNNRGSGWHVCKSDSDRTSREILLYSNSEHFAADIIAFFGGQHDKASSGF
jgi:hypothetical protein